MKELIMCNKQVTEFLMMDTLHNRRNELFSTDVCQNHQHSKYDDDDYVYRDAEQGLPIRDD